MAQYLTCVRYILGSISPFPFLNDYSYHNWYQTCTLLYTILKVLKPTFQIYNCFYCATKNKSLAWLQSQKIGKWMLQDITFNLRFYVPFCQILYGKTAMAPVIYEIKSSGFLQHLQGWFDYIVHYLSYIWVVVFLSVCPSQGIRLWNLNKKKSYCDGHTDRIRAVQLK